MNELAKLIELWVRGEDIGYAIHDQLIELGYPKIAKQHSRHGLADRYGCVLNASFLSNWKCGLYGQAKKWLTYIEESL